MPSPSLSGQPFQTDARQKLRLRRLLIAVGVYASCALMLVLIGPLGFLPPGFIAAWVAAFACMNLLFFLLIRTGVNLRFKDPSMTMVQMAVAIGAVAFILYHAGAMRGGLLLLLMVIMLFGVLRLTTAELLAMGALCSTSYAAVILLLAIRQPGSIDPRVEWGQWVALTTMLAVSCTLVGYMSSVRRQLSQSLRTIRDMAQHDALTGVFNRHHMDETIVREIGRCERGAPAFLALIVDIDHFKRINDSYGHLVGDQVLKAVAHCTREAVRKADYMARYGGEEFVLIVAARDGAEAGAACERIRVCVEQLRIPEMPLEGVTVSIGATFFRRGDTQASILQRADAALYRAKNGGRNRAELDLAAG